MNILIVLMIFLSFVEAKMVITPTIGKQLTTPKEEFKDDEILMGVGIQAYINNNFAFDMRMASSDSNLMADGGKTDLERGSVNLLYDFIPNQKFSPYVFGGIGYEKLHRTYQDIKSQSFYQAGSGIKFAITDNIDFITEAKYLRKADTKNNEVIATCGFGVKFGVDKDNKIKTLKKSSKSIEIKEATNTTNLNSLNINKNNIKPAIKPLEEKNIKNSNVVFSDEVIASKYLLKTKDKVIPQKNYIQIAALTKKSNLIATLKKLKNKGLKVKTIKKGDSTVVLVGPYSKKSITKVYKIVKTFQKDAFYKKL